MRPQLLLPGERTWRRELPAAGQVRVAPGEPAEAGTLVAEGQTATPPVVVDLGQAQATVAVGQEVQAGEIVARRKKLIGSGEEVRSPVAGKVVLVREGELLLQPPPLALTLEAQLPGTVTALRAGWSVDVQGCFGLVRGHGSSAPAGAQDHIRGRYGVLGQDLAVEAEPLTVNRLQALAGQGIRAVIAGSWGEPPLPAAIPDWPAIFLTEPVPGKPMASPIAEALRAHVGQPAALRLGPQPLLGFTGAASGGEQRFGPGSWVRTADGRTARLAAVGDRPRFFPSGLRATPAEVDLGDRTESLPLDSLEWIA